MGWSDAGDAITEKEGAAEGGWRAISKTPGSKISEE